MNEQLQTVKNKQVASATSIRPNLGLHCKSKSEKQHSGDKPTGILLIMAIEERDDGGVGDYAPTVSSAASLAPTVFLSKSEVDFGAENESSFSSYVSPYSEEYLRAINISVLTVFGTIIAVGLVGNLIVILSILFSHRRIAFTSMMLCSLAVADLLFVTVFIPIYLFSEYHHQWIFGAFGCQLVSFLWFLSPASSAIMLLVISAERYLVIIHPLQAKAIFTKKMGLIIIGVAWVISTALSLVSVPFTKYEEHQWENEILKTCNRSASTKLGRIVKVAYIFVFLYLVPLLGMIFCNIRVIVTLYLSSRVTKSLQSVNLMRGYNNGAKAPGKGSYSAGRLSCGMESEISTVTTCHPGGGGAISGESVSGMKLSTEGDKEGRSGGSRKNRMHNTLQERKRVMLLLGVLVVMFAVLWGPIVIVPLISLHHTFSHKTGTLLSLACHMLAMSNSALNPVVYALISRSFRQVIKSASTACGRRVTSCCRGRGGGYSSSGGGSGRKRYWWRALQSTRDRASSMSNSRDGTQLTQYSVRSVNNVDSLKRCNGANPQGYIYLRNNNVH